MVSYVCYRGADRLEELTVMRIPLRYVVLSSRACSPCRRAPRALSVLPSAQLTVKLIVLRAVWRSCGRWLRGNRVLRVGKGKLSSSSCFLKKN